MTEESAKPALLKKGHLLKEEKAEADTPAPSRPEQVQDNFFVQLLISLVGLAIGVLLVQAVTGFGVWTIGKIRGYFSGVPAEIRSIPALSDLDPSQYQTAATRASRFLSSPAVNIAQEVASSTVTRL